MAEANIGDVFEYFPQNHEHTYLAVITHKQAIKRLIFILGNLVIRGFTNYKYCANIYALKKGEDDLLHYDSTDKRYNGLVEVPFSRKVFRRINAKRIDLSSFLNGKKLIEFPMKAVG